MTEKTLLNDSAASIKKINSYNAEFFTKNGFLALNFKDVDSKTYDRVFLHRIFPFELLWEYISVLDSDLNEIGVIYSVEDFSEEIKQLLKDELAKKYYQPKIKTIHSLKERYGFSYWNVLTADNRSINFTMQDTFRNIIRVGEDKAILLDVDGNRFVIESISALDKKSYKKIELYL